MDNETDHINIPLQGVLDLSDENFVLTLPDKNSYSTIIPPIPVTGWNPLTISGSYDSNTTQSVKIEAGDIKLGDVSLKSFIQEISHKLEIVSQRINVLTVNQKLEQDWENLRKLGQEYRDLEKQILEKIQIWNSLNN